MGGHRLAGTGARRTTTDLEAYGLANPAVVITAGNDAIDRIVRAGHERQSARPSTRQRSMADVFQLRDSHSNNSQAPGDFLSSRMRRRLRNPHNKTTRRR